MDCTFDNSLGFVSCIGLRRRCSAGLRGLPTLKCIPSRPAQKFQSFTAPRACVREVDPLAASPLGAPKVLCVGEALLDVVADSAVPGGAPANLAVGLARLGTASALIGAVGNDEDGATVETALKEASVNCDGLQRVASPTRRVLVDLNEVGDREFVGFSGDNASFADAVGVDIGLVDGVLFYASQFVAIGTLGLAFPGSRTALVQTLEVAKACQLRTFVDVNWRPAFWQGQPSQQAAREIILGFLRFVPLTLVNMSFCLAKRAAEFCPRFAAVLTAYSHFVDIGFDKPHFSLRSSR